MHTIRKRLFICIVSNIYLSEQLDLLFNLYLSEQVLFNSHTMQRSSEISTKTKLMKRLISNSINSLFLC